MLSSSQRPRYRPDVDGLRALAILPVLFFHYRVPPFSGGFVGVDIFFVISGYLITQLIAAEGEQFSIAHFYERRIRRIFPALFAMLAVTTIAAVLILFPADLVRYANSLLATAGFAANFEFWRETGYFDVLAADKPLLHLWSIAVEEQFYLFFPAILLMFAQRRIAATALIFAASLGFALWGTAHAPSATFYLLPGRAWELMLGALLALGAFPPIAQRRTREALALAGAGLIAFATFFYTRDTPFPGAAALAPCLGAALLIYAAQPGPTAASAVLSLSPLVFIGRISYSLYLWHWPLYVFTRYLRYRDPAPAVVACLIAASFALAIASYYFVEQPFRRGQLRFRRPQLFTGGLATMVTVAAVSLVLLEGDGLPQRLRPDLRSILAEQDDHEPRIDTCLGISPQAVRDGKMCQIGVIGGKPSFILWGDSHADAVLPAISDVAKREGRTGLFAGGRSCPPLLDVTTPRPECRAFNANVLAQASRPEIREVILEARWAKYAEGSTYGDEPEGHIVLSDNGGTDNTSNHAVFARGLARTVKALSGKKIVIVASVPEIGWPVPAVLAREKLADKARREPPSEDAYFERQKFVLSTFAQLQRKDGVTLVYPHAVLCRSGTCAVSLNGIPLYRDEHHLSVYGALQLMPLFSKAM
ncbi:MAG TPA: acyltransferase family protein [Rhizomicrobium sp.]|nr:acyltransferase family protein [Rhizomicrobium sp.]